MRLQFYLFHLPKMRESHGNLCPIRPVSYKIRIGNQLAVIIRNLDGIVAYVPSGLDSFRLSIKEFTLSGRIKYNIGA